MKKKIVYFIINKNESENPSIINKKTLKEKSLFFCVNNILVKYKENEHFKQPDSFISHKSSKKEFNL